MQKQEKYNDLHTAKHMLLTGQSNAMVTATHQSSMPIESLRLSDNDFLSIGSNLSTKEQQENASIVSIESLQTRSTTTFTQVKVIEEDAAVATFPRNKQIYLQMIEVLT